MSNSSENFRLSEKQKLAIIAFVSPGKKSFKDVANQVGVSERTLRNWRKQPHFKAALEEVFTTLKEKGIEAHDSYLDAVLDSITSMAMSPIASFRERLGTAQVLLNYESKVVELVQFARRLKKLEKDINVLSDRLMKIEETLEQNKGQQ